MPFCIRQAGGMLLVQLLRLLPTRLIPSRSDSHSTSSQSRNKFVETALAYALTYVSSLSHSKIEPASITILADTDYYSHDGSSNSASPRWTDQRFIDFNVPLAKAHKTGLGSSAALVTAFTAAVFAHYLDPEGTFLKSDVGKARLHNLAQAAHCAAQGKIGSGFDVAAAVHGSCVYKRFSPSILEGLAETGTEGFSTRLKAVVEGTDSFNQWDTRIQKSSAIMPEGLRLVMCDVDCGSETVGMVKKVLSWRKENHDEAALLWGTLQKGNEDLAGELQRLDRATGESRNDYDDLSTIIETIRSLIREMSLKAGVPIEPKVQTELLDACCQVPGVVGGVVPGAGGYDAIALLVDERKHNVFSGLHGLLDHYTVDAEEGEGASIGKVRLLSVKQEMEGVKMMNPTNYEHWTR